MITRPFLSYTFLLCLSIMSTQLIAQEVTALEKSINTKKDSLALIEKMIVAEKANAEAIKTEKKMQKAAEKERKSVEKRTEKSNDAADRLDKAERKREKELKRTEREKEKADKLRDRYSDAKEKLLDIEKDIQRNTEKLEKQTAKGKLSPQEIQKWNEKISRLKTRAIEQQQNIDKAERKLN